jgi:hypothetical protein
MTTGGYPESHQPTPADVIDEDIHRGNTHADAATTESIRVEAERLLAQLGVDARQELREVLELASAHAQRLARLSLAVGHTPEGQHRIRQEAAHLKAQILNTAAARAPEVQRAIGEAVAQVMSTALKVAITALAAA